MKISIIGYSGSGKSTLAKIISKFLDIPLLYLDTIQFKENWEERNIDESIQLVSDFLNSNKNWVIDGNYSKLIQAERLEQSDLIIYLNFNRFNCLYRALKRYKNFKNKTRESITNGCIEKIDLEFIWWILYKGRSKNNKKHYNDLRIKYDDHFITLKNQKQLTLFTDNLNKILK